MKLKKLQKSVYSEGVGQIKSDKAPSFFLPNQDPSLRVDWSCSAPARCHFYLPPVAQLWTLVAHICTREDSGLGSRLPPGQAPLQSRTPERRRETVPRVPVPWAPGCSSEVSAFTGAGSPAGRCWFGCSRIFPTRTQPGLPSLRSHRYLSLKLRKYNLFLPPRPSLLLLFLAPLLVPILESEARRTQRQLAPQSDSSTRRRSPYTSFGWNRTVKF